MNLISEDYLMHHGVKGMKWGVRNEPNPKYSYEQRLRDRNVYGRLGVRRINKHMNNGLSISGARSHESNRINTARRSARVSGQAGSVVGTLAGALVGAKIAPNIINKYMTTDSAEIEMVAKGAIMTGSATIGKQIGRYGGQSIGMIMKGYNPNRFR